MAINLTINGNSTFDSQVNKILSWDGSHQSLGLGPDAIAGISIGLGLILALYGYKLVRPAIFFAGFAIGAVASFVLAEKVFHSASYVDTATWIAFFVGGFIAGSLLVWFYKVGLFAVGALAGVLLATQIHTSFGHLLYPSNPNTMLIILSIVFGIAFGIIALILERPFLIIATSIAGAITAVWGIGYFGGNYPNAANLVKHFENGTWQYEIPTTWWLYLSGTTLLAFIAMYFQFRSNSQSKSDEQANRAIPATGYANSATPAVRGNPVAHC